MYHPTTEWHCVPEVVAHSSFVGSFLMHLLTFQISESAELSKKLELFIMQRLKGPFHRHIRGRDFLLPDRWAYNRRGIEGGGRWGGGDISGVSGFYGMLLV